MRRRRGKPTPSPQRPSKKKRGEAQVDWEYNSDDELSLSGSQSGSAQSDIETREDAETADEKRIRLAKDYLKKLGAEEAAEDEAERSEGEDSIQLGVTGGENDPKSAISRKIKDDLLRDSGRLRRPIAARFTELEKDEDLCLSEDHCTVTMYAGHLKAVTCVAVSDAEDVIYTGSKDCSIIQWDCETGKVLQTFRGLPQTKTYRHITDYPFHRDEVLAIALSSDGKYLASGGKEKLIYIWDTKEGTVLGKLKGHRDTISALSFQLGTHTLLSAGFDRCVRVWNASELTFVEELYGHQSAINDIDSMYRERGITCSSDRTLRFWKIPEETQLVFQTKHKASVDCIKMIDEVHFFAGSQDGAVSLWHTSKKQACSMVQGAHSGKWISAVAVLRNSDLLASGSHDGFINLWRVDFETRKLSEEPCARIKAVGFVNSLRFSPSGKYLVASLGKDHRFGRWETVPKAQNGIQVIRLSDELVL